MATGFIKLTTGVQNIATTGSEGVAVTDYDTMVEEMQEIVPDFYLFTPTQLKNEISIASQFHIRPMSDREYNQYLEMIRTQVDPKGMQLFKHDIAAIARIIKENYLKYFPTTQLDPLIENTLKLHYEIRDVLKTTYEEALESFREPFVVTKAEEVESLYTPDEIQRLRSLGLSFNEEKFSAYDQVRTMLPSTPVSLNKKAYEHPMLKYNLLKGK